MPLDEQSEIEFDEAWYLSRYPDIAKAVQSGRWPSGLDHFLRHGRDEGRKIKGEIASIPIMIGKAGNVANRMFRYMYCRNLQNILAGSALYGYQIPEFGLTSGPLEIEGRPLKIADGHIHNMASIAYKLRNRIYDGLIFNGYVQRLEYYPNRDICADYFMQRPEIDRTHLGPSHITLNIRGAEILGDLHPDYAPVPISFYEQIVGATGLSPVIMGQLGDDAYSHEIRRRFSGCIFLESKSAAHDFEIIRSSTNIVPSVSSFSWLAAWLSTTAQSIHLPMRGFMNPRQRPDIDLLPISDGRYRFYDFPVLKWGGTDGDVASLLARDGDIAEIDAHKVRDLIP